VLTRKRGFREPKTQNENRNGHSKNHCRARVEQKLPKRKKWAKTAKNRKKELQESKPLR